MKQIRHIILWGLGLFLVACENPVVFSGPTSIDASKTQVAAGENVTITINRPYRLQNSTGEKIFKAKLGICFVDDKDNCVVNTSKNNEVDLPDNITLVAGNEGAVYGQYSATSGDKAIEHKITLTSTVSGTYAIKGFFLYDAGGELIAKNAQFSKEVTITFE